MILPDLTAAPGAIRAPKPFAIADETGVMTRFLTTLASFALTACATGQADPSRPGEVGFGAVRTPDLLERVGGNREISIEVAEGVYRCGRSSIEAPLPDGYPEPTPPGAIDIKNYPSIRRAEWVTKGGSNFGMNVGFWPLFNHIKDRNIAMTSPVEMDYPGVFPDLMKSDEPVRDGEATMSFLYRSSALGPTGEDGKIMIRDTAPVTVVSIGMNGPYGLATMRKGLAELREWLKVQDEWEVVGTPRSFSYNGPYIAERWKWSEVQVPVRRREVAKAPTGTETAPVAAQPAEKPAETTPAPAEPTSR